MSDTITGPMLDSPAPDPKVQETPEGQMTGLNWGARIRNLAIGTRIWTIVGIGVVGIVGLGVLTAVLQSKLDTNQARLAKFISIADHIDKIHVEVLKMQRSEKDFLLHNADKYRDSYLKAAKDADSELKILDRVPEVKPIAGTVKALHDGINTHIGQFKIIFRLQKALGFDEKSGLQGDLRKAVHAVEAELKKARLDNLTVKMLMMRRHEKDFIMRGAEKYIGRIHKRQAEFQALLKGSGLPEARQNKINSLLDIYVGSFKKFAQTSLAMKTETEMLSRIFADMGPSFEKVYVFAAKSLKAGEAAYAETRRSLLITLLGITIAILAISVVCGYVIARGIVGPIQGLADIVGRLSDGDTDVVIEGTEFRDETGTVAKALEGFRENLIETAKLQADQRQAEQKAQEEERQREEQRHEAEQKALEEERERDLKHREAEREETEAREREAAERQQHAERIDVLITDFDETSKMALEAVAAAASQMQNSAQGMSAIADQTNQQASAVAGASEEATANVQTVASATEELSASIQEISRQVAQSNEIAQNAVAEAKQTNQKVEGLAEAAQKIGDVVNLINDIASQTNLLALNATIEAARAGDAGKGFAVVASEVKSLASQTSQATEEIGTQITEIQEATTDAVQAIQGIGTTIGEIGEIAASIASAVEEQSAATREIASNVQQAAAGTQEVSGNIAQVTQAASESQTSSGQILEAANGLAEQGVALREEVKKFLEAVRAA